MILLKDKIKPEDGVIHVRLPEAFRDKTVEVVVNLENEAAKKLMTDVIKIDTTKWRFNREEIYAASK
jgi:hypothetical protein